jgi:hypothetical protein
MHILLKYGKIMKMKEIRKFRHISSVIAKEFGLYL